SEHANTPVASPWCPLLKPPFRFGLPWREGVVFLGPSYIGFRVEIFTALVSAPLRTKQVQRQSSFGDETHVQLPRDVFMDATECITVEERAGCRLTVRDFNI
ncbi:unnamed protein product, partial [Pylaiella littoralis]